MSEEICYKSIAKFNQKELSVLKNNLILKQMENTDGKKVQVYVYKDDIRHIADYHYEKKDYVKALEYYKLAAAVGDKNVNTRINECIGHNNLMKNEELYTKKIDNKESIGEDERHEFFSIGKKMLKNGQAPAGIKFIKYAADKGLRECDFVLGYCYQVGLGVKKDVKVAEGFFRRAMLSNKKYQNYTLRDAYREGERLLQ